MINRSSFIFVLTLLINLFIHSSAIADQTEDKTDKESLNSLLGGNLMNAPGPDDFSSIKFSIIKDKLAVEEETKKSFIISDLRSKGDPGSDARSAFGWAFPMQSQWKVDQALTEMLKDSQHREEEHMSIDKREMDSKLLRCMIGRVYRPCWKD